MDELPSLDAPEFVVCDKRGEKVKGSLLAIYVRKHLNYLLVRNRKLVKFFEQKNQKDNDSFKNQAYEQFESEGAEGD